jgi:uncharacterized protein YigA (DUF484 family)
LKAELFFCCKIQSTFESQSMTDISNPASASTSAPASPVSGGITETDILEYLLNTPEFFERHAPALATVQLRSAHGHRAVSLQERQAEMLRDKIKALEQRTMDMMRYGNENMVIADKMQRWTRDLLLTLHARDMPSAIIDGLQSQFLIPQAAIKVWGVNGLFSDMPFAQGVSDDLKLFAASLKRPYCGVKSGFEAENWLDDPKAIASMSMVALRVGASSDAFGMIVLASPDPKRFSDDMGTEFLDRIGEISSAALSRLRAPAQPATVPANDHDGPSIDITDL